MRKVKLTSHHARHGSSGRRSTSPCRPAHLAAHHHGRASGATGTCTESMCIITPLIIKSTENNNNKNIYDNRKMNNNHNNNDTKFHPYFSPMNLLRVGIYTY
jgi:hypothetical protein